MATVSSAPADRRHVVATVEELPPGATRIVAIGGREIGVVNDGGRLYALRNRCPHHGAPLCRGRVAGFMRTGTVYEYDYSGDDVHDRVLLCPWHGYKFRLEDGRCIDPHAPLAVKTYRVEVEDGDVVVYV